MFEEKFFNLDLKEFNESSCLSSSGNLFHNTGPVTENALSPYVFVLDFGTFSRFLVEERKVLVLLRGTNNSLM